VWLHTPSKDVQRATQNAEQATHAETKICAVDLNINEHIAVCTVQTVEGTIIATRLSAVGER